MCLLYLIKYRVLIKQLSLFLKNWNFLNTVALPLYFLKEWPSFKEKSLNKRLTFPCNIAKSGPRIRFPYIDQPISIRSWER